MANTETKFHDFTFTKPVIMAHPHLDAPKAIVKGGKEKYSATFVVPQNHADFERLKTLVLGAASEKFPGQDIMTTIKNWPWRSGTVEADTRKAKMEAAGKAYDGSGEFQRGHLFLVGRSDNPPVLAGFENGKMVEYPEQLRQKLAREKFFFGAEVYASLTIVSGGGSDGILPYVTAYLNHVLATGA